MRPRRPIAPPNRGCDHTRDRHRYHPFKQTARVRSDRVHETGVSARAGRLARAEGPYLRKTPDETKDTSMKVATSLESGPISAAYDAPNPAL
jgi:hypothetical protein